MKYGAVWFSGLMLVALVACRPPTPTAYKTASELMQVPVVLGIEGGRLSARAVVHERTLSVSAKVPKETTLRPMWLHVITQGGVWTAPAMDNNGEASASGPAANLRRGERVQVVMSFEDEKGQHRLLRDESVMVE